MGVAPAGLSTKASVARTLTTDRIVLDATKWDPAMTVRVELTPLEASILRAELDVLLLDHDRNAEAYAYEIATHGYDQVMP